MPESLKLTKKQHRGLNSLALVYERFTPIQHLVGINSETADQLVELGLAEVGECSERYKEILQYETGYRLTRAGQELAFRTDKKS